MGVVRDAAIEAWNTYLRDLQADESGETWLTLIGFDSVVEVWEDGTPVRDAAFLTHETYQPRASTALNDAIAHAVRLADEKLKALGDVKVLVPILTDGFENASAEYPGRGNPALKAMIAEREAQGNFTFTYLSADPMATPAGIAQDLSIPAGNFAYFSTDAASVKATSAGLSNVTRAYRSSAAMTTDSAFEDAGENADYRSSGKADSK